MLTQPNGNLMVCDAISKMNLDGVRKIVLVALEDHLAGNEAGVKDAFSASGIKHAVEIFSLKERTKSQPETVARYLETLDDDVPFFIKDCDNQFSVSVMDENSIVLDKISNAKRSDVTNKSYCTVNDNLQVMSIVEKKVISETFCVGGYSFKSSKQYLASFNEVKNYENLYVSHVVSHMILESKIPFFGKFCSGYEDWGTLEDWLSYKRKFRTLFIDIDGVLVQNSSQFFEPKWGETSGVQENVEYLKGLRKDGKTQVILTTARSSTFRESTENQLRQLGIEYDHIVFDLFHAKRLIVNDHSNSNPYPTCEAICIERNSGSLRKYDSVIKES